MRAVVLSSLLCPPPPPPGLYSPHIGRGTASSTVLVCLVYQSYCGKHRMGVLQGLSLPTPTACQGRGTTTFLPASALARLPCHLPGVTPGATHHEETAALLVGAKHMVLQVDDAAAVGAEPRGPHGLGVLREQLCRDTGGR